MARMNPRLIFVHDAENCNFLYTVEQALLFSFEWELGCSGEIDEQYCDTS